MTFYFCKNTPASMQRIPPPPISSMVSTGISTNFKCFLSAWTLEDLKDCAARLLMAKTRSPCLVLNSKQLPQNPLISSPFKSTISRPLARSWRKTWSCKFKFYQVLSQYSHGTGHLLLWVSDVVSANSSHRSAYPHHHVGVVNGHAVVVSGLKWTQSIPEAVTDLFQGSEARPRRLASVRHLVGVVEHDRPGSLQVHALLFKVPQIHDSFDLSTTSKST